MNKTYILNFLNEFRKLFDQGSMSIHVYKIIFLIILNVFTLLLLFLLHLKVILQKKEGYMNIS